MASNLPHDAIMVRVILIELHACPVSHLELPDSLSIAWPTVGRRLRHPLLFPNKSWRVGFLGSQKDCHQTIQRRKERMIVVEFFMEEENGSH